MKISSLQVMMVSIVICYTEDCEDDTNHFSFIGSEFPKDRLLPSEEAEEWIARHYAETGHKKMSLHSEERTVTVYNY
jgi:hypothetical protein